MTLETLNQLIGLQPELRLRVEAFEKTFDFERVSPLLHQFRDQARMHQAVEALQEKLGSDPDHIKILACMLKAAADAYEQYQALGIDDEIYEATMKCFPRFAGECRRMTGRYAFDREWWTVRQAGGHLFRLGALEYEIREGPGQNFIGIHIPSDADLRPACCSDSLKQADAFFQAHFPQYADCRYRCHSWMLAPELEWLLPADSNILQFQRRFDIIIKSTAEQDYLAWVYQTGNRDVAALPERTTLQRNLKRHLLAGGILSDCVGFLKR